VRVAGEGGPDTLEKARPAARASVASKLCVRGGWRNCRGPERWAIEGITGPGQVRDYDGRDGDA